MIAIIKSLLEAPTDTSNNDLVVITLNLKIALASLVPPKFTEIFRNMRFPLFSGYILKRLAREGFTEEKYHILQDFSRLFSRLDEAFFLGRKIEPIIDLFIKNELLPGLLEK